MFLFKFQVVNTYPNELNKERKATYFLKEKKTTFCGSLCENHCCCFLFCLKGKIKENKLVHLKSEMSLQEFSNQNKISFHFVIFLVSIINNLIRNAK